MEDTFDIRHVAGEARIIFHHMASQNYEGASIFWLRRMAAKDYLFMGQRGVLTVPTVNAKVKAWCRAINLIGNYGSHSLRKTWGYHQRVSFGTDLPTLMVCFNHSTQKQTLNYLCIQPEEIRNVYEDEL